MNCLDADITAEGNLDLKTADLGLRFLNSLIDGIALLAIILGITAVTDSQSNFLGSIVSLIYYISFEVSTGRTIGKYLTGTIVVKEDGGKPEFTDVLIRSISRFRSV